MKTKLVKIGDVNPTELSRISQIIKGHMSISELAERIGVNPSTVSRIKNEKITSPVSDNTLLRLAELITPEMGITREDLFRANGYKEVVESEPYRSRREMEALASSIIVQGINNKGHDVWQYKYANRIRYLDMLSLEFDLMVKCEKKLVDDGFSNNLWGFSYLMPRGLPLSSRAIGNWDQETKRAPSRVGMTFLQRISFTSMMYYQISEIDNIGDYGLEDLPSKVSLVVDRKEEYDYIVKKYKNIVVPMNASLVLIDTSEGKVKAEFPFKNQRGDRGTIFFDGLYFDDDDNLFGEQEYYDFLEDMIDEEISKNHD